MHPVCIVAGVVSYTFIMGIAVGVFVTRIADSFMSVDKNIR